MPSAPMPVLLLEPTGVPGVYREHRAIARRVRKRSLVQTQTGALASVIREVFRVAWEPRFDGVDESWRMSLAGASQDVFHVALKATDDFAAEDFTTQSKGVVIPLPVDFQTKGVYVAYARPSRLGNFSFVYLYQPGQREVRTDVDGIGHWRPVNVISQWVQPDYEVTLRGELYTIIHSRDPIMIGAESRMVEAGGFQRDFFADLNWGTPAEPLHLNWGTHGAPIQLDW